MHSLREVLEKVPDAYEDFVDGMCSEFHDDPEGQENLINWIKQNPDASTEQVLAHVFDIDLDSIPCYDEEE